MLYLQTFVSVLLILAIAVGLYYLNSRLKGKLGGGSGCIKIIESVSLGDQRRLVIVKVADQAYLVGSTAHQISMLAPVDAASIADLADSDKPVPPEMAFLGYLKGKKR